MLDAVDLMYLNIRDRLKLTREAVGKKARQVWEEEKGSTSTVVIEIVMVGMILVLGYLFREQIGALFSSLWNTLVKGGGTGKATIESMANPFGESGAAK